MTEFERTVAVTASPEDAFRFLADPKDLPQYVATMILSRPEEGGRLHVAAEVEGRHEEGEARFSADPSTRRMEWGAPGAGGYSGWLQVADAEGGSSVTIHLHVEHDHDQSEINRALDETVSNVQRLLGTA